MFSRLMWIGLVVMLIVPKPSLAQADGWSNGCDSRAKHIIATTTGLDYERACKVYTGCAEGSGTAGVCQMRALLTLSDICETARCKIEAQIYAAAITMSNNRYNFDVLEPNKGLRELQMALPKALNELQLGDYESAAAIYLSIPPDVYNHPMLPLSAGLNYELMGDSDKALAAYEQAAQISYSEPLLYYTRGNLLAASGRSEEAAIDYSLLAQYIGDDAVYEKLVKPLVTEFPLPAAIFEAWKAYPVVVVGSNTGGDWMSDETQETSREIKLTKLNNGKKLAVQYLSQQLSNSYKLLPDTLMFTKTIDQIYRFSISDTDEYGIGGTTTTLEVNMSTFLMTEDFFGFEYRLSTTFILRLASESDPRLHFDTVRCPGAALSRLKASEQGVAFRSVSGELPRVFDAVDGQAIGIVDTFTAIAGPVCHADGAWWKIELSDGTTGWAIESEGKDYQLAPENSTLIPPYKIPPYKDGA